MDSKTDFTHDEEGYCGVTYQDFVERFPNYQGEDLDIEGDLPNPFEYDLPSERNAFLKNISRTATRVLSRSNFLNNTRRMFWGYFLGTYTQDSLEDLSNHISKERKKYWEKVDYYNKQKSIERIHSLDPQIFHPLAPAETNPWAMNQMIKQLMEEIWQDVERTYQERTLFQSDPVRKTLQRILFVWSMEHEYISYKQGMNELLAIIYIVCYRNQNKTTLEYNDGNYKYFENVFSNCPKDVEADSYTLFNALMTKENQIMYDTSAMNHFDKKRVNVTNPLIARCNYIFNDLLKECDFNLYSHLKNIELEPHLFLIRWIRLMFSREFNVNETLNLWDYLLSDYYFELKVEDSPKFTFQSVDFFSVAMIIFVKQNLMENDINYCLQRLFKYPPIEDISLLTRKALEIKRKFVKKEETKKTDFDQFHDAYESEHEIKQKELKELEEEEERYETNTSKDNTPKAVVIKWLDEGKGMENGNSDSESCASNSTSTPTNLKKELENVATEIQEIYEKVLKNNKDELLVNLKNVQLHLSKIISDLDSQTP